MARWSERKQRLFKPDHIRLAWERLQTEGWVKLWIGMFWTSSLPPARRPNGPRKTRDRPLNYWRNHLSLIALHKSKESKSPTVISKGFQWWPVLWASNTPVPFTMSSIAIMPVMIFLKALYSLKSHPSQPGNRALLVSLQQLSGVYRPGQGQAEQILRKGFKKNTARDMAIYLAREFSGESGVDLAKYYGNICGAAVTGRYKQISEQISRNRRLKGRVNRVKNKIRY